MRVCNPLTNENKKENIRFIRFFFGGISFI